MREIDRRKFIFLGGYMDNFKIKKLVRSRTDEELLNDLKRVAEANNGKVTQKIYREYRNSIDSTIADDSTICRQIGWKRALNLIGVNLDKYQKNDKISEDELLQEILRLWIELGRQPTTTDLKNRKSKYPRERFSDRFGSWASALNRFIEWANKENFISISTSNEKSEKRRTSRDINARLKYLVLQRDDFKCVVCGRSPATHQNVILHADHIIPYAKGGETIKDNLQTLCQECNWGKGDLM